MNRGEVWWPQAPRGRPAAGVRLTRQAAISVLNALLVVPAIRTVRGIATVVALGREDGLPGDRVLTFDNLGVVPKALLTERITRLRSARLASCAPWHFQRLP